MNDGDDTKARGMGDEAKGRVQEAVGSLTGDEDQKAEGQGNQVKGNVKQAAGDVQNAVSNLTGHDDNP